MGVRADLGRVCRGLEAGDDGHLVVGQVKVKNAQILRHVICVLCAGVEQNALLPFPALHNFGGAALVLGSNGNNGLVLGDIPAAPGAKWRGWLGVSGG